MTAPTESTRLVDLAGLIRSKNAGPFNLTFDIIFPDEASFRTVQRSGVINAEWMAATYHCGVEDVRVFESSSARAIKVTIPRPRVQGSIGDADLHGGQQFAPLLDLPVSPIGR